MPRSLVGLIVGLSLMLIAIAGCGATQPQAASSPASAPTTAPAQRTLGVGLTRWPAENMDPVKAEVHAKSYLALVYDWLVGLAPDGKDISTDTGLANKWEQSTDGRAWTFYLRKGVQFDQGWGEVTAEDVKFSINRNINTQGTLVTNADTIKQNLQEIQVVDPYTVRFVLKAPSLTLPYDLSRPLATVGIVYSKKYLEKVGDDEFRVRPVGSGPYRVAKIEPGLYFKFEARDDYWQFAPFFKDVNYRKVTEESTRVAMLKTGELDLIQVSIPMLEELQAAGFKISEKPDGIAYSASVFQQWEGYFTDKRVRLALNQAINKQELSQTIFKGRAQPLPGGTRFTWSLGVDKSAPPFPYDPKRAKELLSEAGYPQGIEVELLAEPGDPQPIIAQALGGYFEAIGAKTKISILDSANIMARWRGKTGKNAIYLNAPSNRTFAHPALRVMYHSSSALTTRQDPQLDALLETGEKATNVSDYSKAMGQVQRYLFENATEIFLVKQGDFFAVNPKVAKDWPMGGVSAYDVGLPEFAHR